MQVFRVEERQAEPLVAALQQSGVEASIERYSQEAVYVIVTSDTVEAAQLVRSFGHSIRRVPAMEDLTNQPPEADN